MSRNKIFLIILIVVLAIIALIIFRQNKVTAPSLTPTASSSNQGAILNPTNYQQKVGTILQTLALAPDNSFDGTLQQAISDLQKLVVSRQVKDDHLLLFSALDTWQRNLAQANKEVIRGKLETFAKHQSWSSDSITAIVGKHLSAS